MFWLCCCKLWIIYVRYLLVFFLIIRNNQEPFLALSQFWTEIVFFVHYLFYFVSCLTNTPQIDVSFNLTIYLIMYRNVITRPFWAINNDISAWCVFKTIMKYVFGILFTLSSKMFNTCELIFLISIRFSCNYFILKYFLRYADYLLLNKHILLNSRNKVDFL